MTRGYQKPRQRRINIFDFHYVLCPVNVGGNHWTLAVIDNKKKAIFYFDSMNKSDQGHIEMLNKYVMDEYLDIHSRPIQPYEVKYDVDVPQQVGGLDCGVFMCTFAELLTRRAGFNFSQEHIQYLRNKIAWELLTDQLMT
jgi:sentrin-specific protease 1